MNGGIPQLRWPVAVQTLALAFSPERFPNLCKRRFSPEPMFRMKLANLGELVIVFDPKAIRTAFAADSAALHAGEANAMSLGSILGPEHSVMMLDGSEHLRMRRLLLPPFHGDAVRHYEDLVAEIALREISTWPAEGEVKTFNRMRRITLDIILEAVLGVRDTARRARLRVLLPKVLDVNAFVSLTENRFPRLGQGRVGSAFPWVRARREALSLLDAEIAEHRLDPEERSDVLAMLLAARDDEGRGLSDDQARGQLMTLLLAGHETTAGTLAWCFEMLVRHPDKLSRLRAELLDGESDDYLRAVIDETMRVRPIIDVVWRLVKEPFELGGHVLEPGTLMAISLRGAQRDDSFGDATVYRPERMIEAKPEPFTLIPFGGGQRRCLGAAFASMEMRSVLRTAITTLDLIPAGRRAEGQSRLKTIGTVPARGGRVIARPLRTAI